jgi:filamentous hemagglutinin
VENYRGFIASLGNVNITAQNIKNANGQIVAKSNINAASGNRLDNDLGFIEAGKNIDVKSQALNNNFGRIASDQKLTVSVASVMNKAGTIISQNDITIHTDQLDNIGADKLGVIESQANIYINNVRKLNNSGTIAARLNQAIGLTGKIENSGIMTAGGNLLLSGGETINNKHGGLLSGSKSLFAELAPLSQINNDGAILGDLVSLKSQETKNNNLIKANGILDILSSGTVTNNAFINSGGYAYIYAEKLLNNNNIIAASGNLEAVKLLHNKGNIYFDLLGKLTAKEELINDAAKKIEAQDNLEISGNKILNAGQLKAKEILVIGEQNLHNNTSGVIDGSELVSFESEQGSITNASVVKHTEHFSIDTANDASNSGQINATVTKVKAKNFKNSGKILFTDLASIDLSSDFTNNGSITTIDGEKPKSLSSSYFFLTANNTENTATIKVDKLHGKLKGNFNNDAKLLIEAETKLTIEDSYHNNAEVSLGELATISAKNIYNNNIIKAGLLSLSSEQQFANQYPSSTIKADLVNIYAKYINHGGTIDTKDNPNFLKTSVIKFGEAELHKSDIHINTQTQFHNNAAGNIKAKGRLTLIGQDIQNLGTIEAKELSSYAKNEITYKGTLNIEQDAEVLAENTVEFDAKINKIRNLIISSKNKGFNANQLTLDGDLHVQTKEAININGLNVKGNAALITTANGSITLSNSKTIGKSLYVKAGGHFVNNKQLHVTEDAYIVAPFYNNNGALYVKGFLSMFDPIKEHHAQASGSTLQYHSFTNDPFNAQSILSFGKGFNFRGNRFQNLGLINGSGDLHITVEDGGFHNDGSMNISGNCIINSQGSCLNTGSFYVEQNLIVRGTSFEHRPTKPDIIQGPGSRSQQSYFNVRGIQDIQVSGLFVNSGTMNGGQHLNIRAASFDNARNPNANLLGMAAYNLAAIPSLAVVHAYYDMSSLYKVPEINAASMTAQTTQGNFNNFGNINVHNSAALLSNAALNNLGNIKVVDHLALQGTIINNLYLDHASNSLKLLPYYSGETQAPSGTISAGTLYARTTAGAFTNYNGLVEANKGSTVIDSAGNINNSGKIGAMSDLMMKALSVENTFNPAAPDSSQSGILSTGRNIVAQLENTFHNTGDIQAGDEFGSVSFNMDNQGTITATSFNITTNAGVNNAGLLGGTGDSVITANEEINNSGQMQSGSLTLSAGSHLQANNQQLAAQSTDENQGVTISSSKSNGQAGIKNSGAMETSQGNMQLSATDDVLNSKKMSSAADLTINAAGAVVNQGEMAAKGTVAAQGESFTNSRVWQEEQINIPTTEKKTEYKISITELDKINARNSYKLYNPNNHNARVAFVADLEKSLATNHVNHQYYLAKSLLIPSP